MEKLTLNSWGRDYPIMLRKDNYVDNNKLHIGMITDADGFLEPYADLTVNVEGFNPKNNNCALIDTNNLGNDIIFWLMDNKLGKSTARWANSGFCSYPEFEFDLDEVNKYIYDKNTYASSEVIEDEEPFDDFEPFDIDNDAGYDPYLGQYTFDN